MTHWSVISHADTCGYANLIKYSMHPCALLRRPPTHPCAHSLACFHAQLTHSLAPSAAQPSAPQKSMSTNPWNQLRHIFGQGWPYKWDQMSMSTLKVIFGEIYDLKNEHVKVRSDTLTRALCSRTCVFIWTPHLRTCAFTRALGTFTFQALRAHMRIPLAHPLAHCAFVTRAPYWQNLKKCCLRIHQTS